MKVYVKHPLETKQIDFDFTKALAAIGDAGSWVEILSDAGITVSLQATVGGVYSVHVAGGETGTQYNFGLQLLTDGGAVFVDARRIRVQGVAFDAAFDADQDGDDVFIDAND